MGAGLALAPIRSSGVGGRWDVRVPRLACGPEPVLPKDHLTSERSGACGSRALEPSPLA